MISSSILRAAFGHKSIYKKLSGKPSNWHGLFNLNNLRHNLRVEGVTSVDGCSVWVEGRKFACAPLAFTMPDERVFRAIPDLDMDILAQLASYSTVFFDNLPTLLFYTHLDIIVSFLQLDDDGFATTVANDPRFMFRPIRKPTLLEVNANSLFLAQEDDGIVSNRRSPAALKEAVLRLGVRTLELPEDYELGKTLAILERYHASLIDIEFPDEERGFNLKFKKLGAYKANGFYSHETNIVIVDPRAVDVFYHELGHLVFDRKVKTAVAVDAEDSETFARAFYRYVVGDVWKQSGSSRLD